jgi:hypothetical protein
VLYYARGRTFFYGGGPVVGGQGPPALPPVFHTYPYLSTVRGCGPTHNPSLDFIYGPPNPCASTQAPDHSYTPDITRRSVSGTANEPPNPRAPIPTRASRPAPTHVPVYACGTDRASTHNPNTSRGASISVTRSRAPAAILTLSTSTVPTSITNRDHDHVHSTHVDQPAMDPATYICKTCFSPGGLRKVAQPLASFQIACYSKEPLQSPRLPRLVENRRAGHDLSPCSSTGRQQWQVT